MIHVKDVWPPSTPTMEESTSEESTSEQHQPVENDDDDAGSEDDPEQFAAYERVKAIYADQLQTWGLWKQRLCVLKASSIVDMSNGECRTSKKSCEIP